MEANRPRSVGVPAIEGMSPFESMVAAGGVVSPQDEFGGRPKPRFLQEALEAGQRAIDEMRAANAKRKLADQAKDKLGGKP